MLKLRRGIVTRSEPLLVRVGEEERPAWADEALVGEMQEGDEVILNTEALDLGLGSGGFDVVHANLTRGLDALGGGRAAAMKLNYTSLQHAIEPVEMSDGGAARTVPVLVLALHGQLAPAAWAARRASARARIGYLQTWGGALPGNLSASVARLRQTGLLEDHVTAAPAYGGEHEALTTIGALGAATGSLRWDAVIAGPGPGILGSGSELGHGGMAALDTAHASLALGLETIVAPRMSSGDRRSRHRGLSHHTATVLRLLLGDVVVAAPALDDDALAELQAACGGRHQIRIHEAPLDHYAEGGLPAEHMGRGIAEDPLFFAAALAAGETLGAAVGAEVAA